MQLDARFCSAAAIAALRPGLESGPMKASGRASILSFPVRTNSGTMLGSTSVSNARQPGHCRSTYSIIVNGAFGEPRTSPCCGIPANSRWTTSASGKALVSEPRVGTVPDADEVPPPTASAIPTAAPATTSATTAAMTSTFGEARRRSPLRATGGGAAACWRRFLACLPLTGHNGSPRLERRGDDEHNPQLVALDGGPKPPQRGADAGERERRNKQESCGENLPHDAEHGQKDDHVMCHAATPGQRQEAAARARTRCRSLLPTAVRGRARGLRGRGHGRRGAAPPRAAAAERSWPARSAPRAGRACHFRASRPA